MAYQNESTRVLPHRQLINSHAHRRVALPSVLPHRQLINQGRWTRVHQISVLPHRQLINENLRDFFADIGVKVGK
jgi:hypothetical protein